MPPSSLYSSSTWNQTDGEQCFHLGQEEDTTNSKNSIICWHQEGKFRCFQTGRYTAHLSCMWLYTLNMTSKSWMSTACTRGRHTALERPHIEMKETQHRLHFPRGVFRVFLCLCEALISSLTFCSVKMFPAQFNSQEGLQTSTGFISGQRRHHKTKNCTLPPSLLAFGVYYCFRGDQDMLRLFCKYSSVCSRMTGGWEVAQLLPSVPESQSPLGLITLILKSLLFLPTWREEIVVLPWGAS